MKPQEAVGTNSQDSGEGVQNDQKKSLVGSVSWPIGTESRSYHSHTTESTFRFLQPTLDSLQNLLSLDLTFHYHP